MSRCVCVNDSERESEHMGLTLYACEGGACMLVVCARACVCARDGGRDWSGSQGPAGSLAPITVPCTSAAILLSTECVRAPCPHTHTHTHTH